METKQEIDKEKLLQDIEEMQIKLKAAREILRKPLKRLETNTPDVHVGYRKNKMIYRIRDNRDRYFYPHEWIKFFESLSTERQRMTFEFLINTGARINEARHVKVQDIDLDNKRLILRVTKVKAKKLERSPRPRQLSISTSFVNRLRKYIKQNGLKDEDTLDLLTTGGADTAIQTKLEEIGIKDWYMFSVHNIRKTHGNWLKALHVDALEICARLGHDYNTFLKSYGSSDVFTHKDLQEIRFLLGDLYVR